MLLVIPSTFQTAAVVGGSKTDITYTQVSFKSRKPSTSDKLSANAEEPAPVLSKGVPADSKPIPSPKPQLKAKPASSPKPQLKEKPVPSPKPTKKVMVSPCNIEPVASIAITPTNVLLAGRVLGLIDCL